jgi:hypothetical protein
MVNKDLLDYIHSETARGIPKATIRTMLLQSGWDAKDVDEAEHVAAGGLPIMQMPIQPPVQPAQVTPITISQPKPQPIQTLQQQPIQQPHIEPIQTQPHIQQPVQPAQQPIRPIAEQPHVEQPRITQPNLANAMENYRQKMQPLAGSQMPFASGGSQRPASPASNPIPQSPQQPNQQMGQPFSMQGLQPSNVNNMSGSTLGGAPMEVRPQKARPSKMLLPIVLLLFLIAGGAAYGYFAGYFISMSAISNEAYNSIRNAKSVNFDTTISVDMNGVAQASNPVAMIADIGSGISLTAKGAYDHINENDPKFTTALSIKAGIYEIGLEARSVLDNIYINATKLPVTPWIDTSKIQNQWLMIPGSGDDVEKYIPSLASAGIGKSAFENLTDEQKAHIADMAAKAKFITVTKRYTPEMMNNVLSYHFSFDLDRNGITSFLFDLENYIHEIGKEDSELSAFSTEGVKTSLDKVKNFNGEAWIGRSDHLPYKLMVNFESQEGEDTASLAKVNFVSIFSGWNQPITVEAPVNAQLFSTFLENNIGGGVGDNEALDAKLKTSFSFARPQAEMYSDANGVTFKGFCASENFTAVTAGVAEPSKASLVCRDSASAYILYAPLITEPKKIYCMDSKLKSATLEKAPTGFVCQ